MSLRLYLIRHGETEWALSGRHTGLTDIPLTANGENQARALGKHLRGIRFAHVLTSPLTRARQICDLVGLDKAPEIEPDLAELEYGDYEGKRSVDIRKRRPDGLIARFCTLDGKVALFSHASSVASWRYDGSDCQ